MTPLIITEDTARAALRVLTTALHRMPPGVPLCAHHDGTMRHWRDTHPRPRSSETTNRPAPADPRRAREP